MTVALARLYGTYIVVQCKARWPGVIDKRFSNTLFVISPQGEVVHKAAKNHLWCRERSCVPHDVYDRWVELFGDGIDAFYPVLRTEPPAERRTAAARRGGRGLPREHRPARRPGKLQATCADVSQSTVHSTHGVRRRGRLGTGARPVAPARRGVASQSTGGGVLGVGDPG
jgi:hypothetical protein